jgi:hypothetical protein
MRGRLTATTWPPTSPKSSESKTPSEAGL